MPWCLPDAGISVIDKETAVKNMKILVVGGGGREHAIVWKLAQSRHKPEIFCAPGNGGIAKIAKCVPIKATDIGAMVDFAVKNDIDLTVVAPDDPLAMGMVDALQAAGKRAFGPTAAAALIEASKGFSKQLMKKYGIPTADYRIFDNYAEADEYLKSAPMPIVIKADGLALGKGVIIAENYSQASEAAKNMLEGGAFGGAGSTIVIEEYMTGPEMSMLCFTDGKTVVPMVTAQDHKRALDNDMGLNTGGMGAFSPSMQYDSSNDKWLMDNVLLPTVRAMEKEGRPFKGVLYFGLMLTKNGIKVLEYNARFGDPETQAVLPRLKSDLVDIFEAIIDERLEEVKISWSDKAAVCVVLASGGYPEKYETGFEISGIEQAEKTGALVFHAGTAIRDGRTVTSGGRVLGVTALGDSVQQARRLAYAAAEKINFQNKHMRFDIGVK